MQSPSLDQQLRRRFTLALGLFAIAATIGTLLRLLYVVDMPWLVFKPWLHAHSHVAMLGWVFPVVLLAMVGQDRQRLPKSFLATLDLSQLMVMGMLVSFPWQGYGAVSIACSLGQLVLGYVLVAQVWRTTAHWPVMGSRTLVRLAFIFQLTSTMGIWAMGPLLHSGLAGTEWYYWSIQWFLHFQFNGWFWFAAMAIGSRWAELHGVTVRLDPLTTALWATSTVLSFALVVAWSERLLLVLSVNAIGVLLQVVAAWRTMQAMRHARLEAYVKTTPWMRVLIGLMLLSMAAKVGAQALVAMPMVANMALTLRNFVVGFIHLNTLGAITALLLAFAVSQGWFNEEQRTVRLGFILFITGFASSELLLFAQGMAFWSGWGLLPGYYWALFCASALLPCAMGILLLKGRSASFHPSPTSDPEYLEPRMDPAER